MFDLKIDGARRLNKKLNKLGTNVARKVVRPAGRAAMEPVLQAAKNYTPVDTGRLRDSIKVYVRNSRQFGLDVGIQTGTRKRLKIPADAKHYYPSAIEFGTPTMRGRSFMRRAIATRKEQALKILGAGIKAGLKKV
jgi:HK97 gp10 family phage protein